MGKRIAFTLVIAAVVLLTAVPTLEAQRRRDTRIGFGFGTPNTVFVVRPNPFDFKLGYDFTEGEEFIYLGADLRVLNQRVISRPLHFSAGIGGYTKLYPNAVDDEASFEGGLRLPVALSVLLLGDLLELYVEVAPGIDLYPKARFSDDPVQAWVGFTFSTDL